MHMVYPLTICRVSNDILNNKDIKDKKDMIDKKDKWRLQKKNVKFGLLAEPPLTPPPPPYLGPVIGSISLLFYSNL